MFSRIINNFLKIGIKSNLYFVEPENKGTTSNSQEKNIAEVAPAQSVKPYKRCADSFEVSKKWNKEGLKWFVNDLKTHQMINKNTRIKSFQEIFSGKATDKQIEWTGQVDELTYLITRMKEAELIKVKPHEIWRVTCKCFCITEGKTLNHQNMKGRDRPKKAHEIDHMIGEFKRKIDTNTEMTK